MEVYCRETNKQVNIVIESKEQTRGQIAKGKPVICSHEMGCRERRNGVQCFLNCEMLEGRL
jgi:hypothetical protein